MFFKKKKASLMVEFVAILPFMIFCLWLVVNTMFYLNAQSTVHQAAIMAAEVTAQELRGHIVGASGLNNNELTKDIRASVISNAHRVITNTTKYNSLVTLGKVIQEDDIQISDCDTNKIPYICISSDESGESNLSTGSGHDVIAVHILANFNSIGGFNFFKNVKVKGYGYATLAQAERFNYHQDYGENQEVQQ